MKHEEEALLSALLDGELEYPEKIRLHKHLSLCLDCQTEIEALRKIKTILAQAPKKLLPANWRPEHDVFPKDAPALDSIREAQKMISPPMGFLIPIGITVAISLAIGLWALQNRWMFPGWQSSQSFLSLNSSRPVKDMSNESPSTIVAPPIVNNTNQPQTAMP
jgi:anti-sigma factor RsiW